MKTLKAFHDFLTLAVSLSEFKKQFHDRVVVNANNKSFKNTLKFFISLVKNPFLFNFEEFV